MEKRNYNLVLCLVFALSLSLGYNYRQYRDLQEQPVKTVTKTITKYIERKDSMPELKKEVIIRTVKVPVPSKPDTVGIAETPKPVDSLELEITQKVYSDSTYTAYVSGYEASLDSIVVRQKEVTHTILETKTIPKTKYRRWNVGLIGGYGYGFKNKSFEPFVGLGLTLNLF